jgi:ribose transport system ATP-binding protein
MMIGRDLKVVYTAPAAPRGEVVLSARDIRTAAYPRRAVSLDLHRGEILGLAGLVGSGRSELARAIFGIDPVFGGSLTLDGEPLAVKNTRDATARELFLVPEDRKGAGVLLDFSIAQNITLPNLEAYSRSGIVSEAAEISRAERSKAELDIRAPNVQVSTGALSGGNQQKVALAKWLAMNPRVIILDEPTRGIDVGAKFEIYRIMRGLADAGVAVLMISSDMEEVIGVSDRIAVMHEGRISGMLTRDQFSEENVLMLAVGHTGKGGGTAA